MRYILAMVLLLITIPILLLAVAPAIPVDITPQMHAEMAEKYLVARSAENKKKGLDDDTIFIRFLSMYNYHGDLYLKTATSLQAFWINNLHLEADIEVPQPIPESHGTLFWFDLRDFGWNAGSFSAIARREPYFVQPAIRADTAINLRKIIYIDQDPKTLHCEAVIRADWFFRETMELDRSPSYHDALFAKERFKEVRLPNRKLPIRVPRDINGKEVIGETITLSAKNVFKFVEFPKDEDDFEKIFGVDLTRKHIKDFKIDTRRGAVVEGMEINVSIVARQNRLVERTQGPIGAYYKTFDVKETSGKRDFAETLHKDFLFDAGEILVRLPAGGMGCALVNDAKKILATADNRFATDSSDVTKDARVRTPGSCFMCHESAWIAPKDLVKDMLDNGVNIKFYDKKDARNSRAFFLGWEQQLKDDQNPFTKLIARTSKMLPSKNATELKKWRDRYDSPVTAEIAAKEVGLPVPIFKAIVARSVKSRPLMLVRGMKIPRRTWEVDTYRDVMLLIDARRKVP